MRFRYSVFFVALLPTLLAGQPQTAWRIQDAPSALRPVIARADLAIAQLQDSVLRELTSTFARGGADAAINSCHLDTSLTTHLMGREGIAVGRTSDRLRSPTNRAPQWAAEIVRSYAGRRASEIDGFAVDLGEKLGVLRPIAEREICGHCHGPLERLTPRVREVLAERYPADRAVGFAEGEIRGWFWVEMPKPRGNGFSVAAAGR